MTEQERTIIEPLETRMSPLELYSTLSSRVRTSFLLESAVGADRTVSYSFIGCCPKFVLRCDDGKVSGSADVEGEDPIGAVRKVMAAHRTADRRFPFMGGLVGYFGFEFARYLEKKVPFLRDPDFPDYELGFYKEGIVYDHSKFKAYYMSVDGCDSLRKVLEQTDLGRPEGRVMLGRTKDVSSRAAFERQVNESKAKIEAGEAFQVVISRQKEVEFNGDPLKLYQEIRSINPSPYMYYLDFGERKVFGSSPETLVTVRRDEAYTYPIAGTRPLGKDMRQRRHYKEEMLGDEKERAEHSMLVDLARNDLGKVCLDGSVHVADFMKVEEFSHVQHLVSKVQGTLSPELDSFDAFCAVFPAGTVSGAPKPRAMEIISELEQHPRGPYAGAIGYLSLNGDLDSAIAIRTCFLSHNRLRLQAGAGIVYDSEASREYHETESKLGALYQALRTCDSAAKEVRR